jgi:TonB family protein
MSHLIALVGKGSRDQLRVRALRLSKRYAGNSIIAPLGMSSYTLIRRTHASELVNRRLAVGLLLSMLLHALVLSLQFGIPGLMPGKPAALSVTLAPALPLPRAEVPEPPAPPAPASLAPSAVPKAEGIQLLQPLAPVKSAPRARSGQKRKRATPRHRATSQPKPAPATRTQTPVIAREDKSDDAFVLPLPPLPEVPASNAGDDKLIQQRQAEDDQASQRLIEEQRRAEQEQAQQRAQREAEEERASEQARQAEQARQLAQRQSEDEQARQAARQVEEDRIAQLAQQRAVEKAQAQLAQQRAAEEAQAQLAQQRAEEEKLALQARQQRQAEEERALLAQQRLLDEERIRELARQREQERQAAMEQSAREQVEQEARRQALQREQEEAERKARELALQRQAEDEAARRKAQEAAERMRAEAAAAARAQAEELGRQQEALVQERATAARRQAQQASQAANSSGLARPSPTSGTGAGRGGALPRGMLGSDIAERARALARGIDILSGSPPARPREEMQDRRHVVSTGQEHGVPLRMYVDSFRQKIERNGNLNQAQQSSDRVRVDPIVSVSLRSDGSVEDVTILRSSGRSETDEAVRRIVRLNARYSVFPPNVAAQYDVVEIRRIWRFADGLKLLEELR